MLDFHCSNVAAANFKRFASKSQTELIFASGETCSFTQQAWFHTISNDHASTRSKHSLVMLVDFFALAYGFFFFFLKKGYFYSEEVKNPCIHIYLTSSLSFKEIKINSHTSTKINIIHTTLACAYVSRPSVYVVWCLWQSCRVCVRCR